MLKLTGNLVVMRADFINPTYSLDTAEIYYSEVQADRAIYGVLHRGEDANYEFVVSIWEKNAPEPNTITRSLDNIFASFDLADEVALDVASTILAPRIDVGTVRIVGADSRDGYTVYVDGNPVGREIDEFAVPVGDHEVIVAEPGPLGDQPVEIFEVRVRTGRIEELVLEIADEESGGEPTGATDAVDTVSSALQSAGPIKTGILEVRTVPEGAGVFLDEESLGKAPLSLYGVPVGRYELSVSRPLFTELVRVVDVTDGRVASADLDLNLDLESPDIQNRLVAAWKPSVASKTAVFSRTSLRYFAV